MLFHKKYARDTQYKLFTDFVLSSGRFSGYSGGASEFGAYLDWVGGEGRLFAPIYDYVYSAVSGELGSGQRHRKSFLERGSSMLLSSGFSGYALLSEVFTHSLIYGYLTLHRARPDSYWGEVDYKAYITAVCRLVRSFHDLAAVSGIGISVGGDELRAFVVRLLHGLCERSVLIKESLTYYDKASRKPITRNELRLNLIVGSVFRASRCRLYTTPQVCIAHQGQAYYIGEHFADFQRVVRRNKQSTLRSACNDPTVFTELSSVRYRLDRGLLDGNMVIAARGFGISLTSYASEDIAAEMAACTEAARGGSDPKARAAVLAKHAGLYSLYVLARFAEEAPSSGGFYFRFYADFRGRVYADSEAGPTHNRFARYSLMLDDYSPDELDRLDDHRDSLGMYGQYAGLSGLDNPTDFQKVTFVRILFELGKIFKSSAGGEAGFGDLVRIGAAHIGDTEFGDPEDEMVHRYHLRVWEYTRLKNNCPYPLFSDATASGLQVLERLLGAKGSLVSHHLNLVSTEVWCDTYAKIIEQFLMSHTVPARLSAFFKRKYLKKTIMLMNYSGTLYTCFEHFVASLQVPFTSAERAELFDLHKQFYVFVRGIFEGDEFFRKPSAALAQLLGPGARRHLGAWGESSSARKRAMFGELCQTSLLAEAAKPCKATARWAPDVGLEEAIVAAYSDIAALKSGSPKRVLDALTRNGLHKEYLGRGAARGGSGLTRGGLFVEAVEHEARIGKVCETLLARAAAYGEAAALVRGGHSESLGVEFPDGFVAVLAYMHTVVRRSDIKTAPGRIQSVFSFIGSHEGSYLNRPDPESFKEVRLTEEYIVPLNYLDPGKINTSFRANLVHSCDSFMMRAIMSLLLRRGEPGIPIHDCVGARVLARPALASAAREAYSGLRFKCGGGEFVSSGEVTGEFVLL